MKILQINASARAESGNSTRLANTVTAHLKNRHPAAEVEVRDLAKNPLPILDEEIVRAWRDSHGRFGQTLPRRAVVLALNEDRNASAPCSEDGDGHDVPTVHASLQLAARAA